MTPRRIQMTRNKPLLLEVANKSPPSIYVRAKRRIVMLAWEGYVTGRAGNVVQIRG